MTLNPLIKSSSRAGRFKKKLVSHDQLLREAPLLEARLAPILELFRGNHLNESELTALTLVAGLSLRQPGSWLGAAHPSLNLQHKLPFLIRDLPWKFEENILRRLPDGINVGELFNSFALKSTPLAVNRALLNWSYGHYKLKLYFSIPTPAQVLGQQIRGERCVTVLTKASEMGRYVLGERDCLSFTMHDLIHADHFYHDNQAFDGQVNFYNFVCFCFQRGDFTEHLKEERFAAEFDYLISDMNAYAIHLMKCLKSALIHFHPEGESFFENWIDTLKVNSPERLALLALNSKEYLPEKQDQLLLIFFAKFR